MFTGLRTLLDPLDPCHPTANGNRWCCHCCWYHCCSKDPSPPSVLCWVAHSLRGDTVRIPTPANSTNVTAICIKDVTGVLHEVLIL